MTSLRVWSASMPIDFVDGQWVRVDDPRPWNGRRLTDDEVLGCMDAAIADGPQAAYEYLSEHC